MASASIPALIVVPVEDPTKRYTRKNYAERIQPYARDYYYYQGENSWKPRTPSGSYGTYAARTSRMGADLSGSEGNYEPTGAVPKDVNPRLVEVWVDDKKPEKILIHVSRRPFVWVGDDLTQKMLWQRQVIGPLTDCMVARKHGQPAPSTALRELQVTIDGNKQTQASQGGGSKVENKPAWATENNLIGYTCESSIMWGTRGQAIVPTADNLSLKRLPSVYYTKGHLTTDHLNQGNIGWRSEVGPCLFFGNVPECYIDPTLLQ